MSVVTVELSTGQARFRDELGAWREVDLSLHLSGTDVVVPAASPSSLRIGSGTETLVRKDGIEIRFRHVGSPGGSPVVDGRVASFAGPAGESQVAALVHGFEGSLVVGDAATSSYQVEFDLPQGMTVRPWTVEDETGRQQLGVEFVDASGTPVAAYGQGLAHDIAGAEIPVATRLVGQDGGRVTVENSVPAAWMTDAARVFPVTIDPGYTWAASIANGGYDTYVNSDSPTGKYYSQSELRAGSPGFCEPGYPYTGPCPGHENRTRTYLYFSQFPAIDSDAEVSEAHLSMVAFAYNTSCATLGQLKVYLNSQYKTASSIYWDNQPSVYGSPTATFNPTKSTGWENIDVTALAKALVTGQAPNYGFSIRAVSERDSCALRRWRSVETGNWPALYITYNRPPIASSPVPSNYTSVHSLGPGLSVSVSDPDGDPLDRMYFDLYDAGTGGYVWGSPWQSSTSTTVPYGTVQFGRTYAWFAYTCDASLCRDNGPWYFTVTNSAPSAPSLVSPANESIVLGGKDLDLVAGPSTDPDGDAVWYYFQVTSNGASGSSIDSNWISSNTFTVPASSLQEGVTYTWRVYAKDSYGYTSASSTRTFRVDRRLGAQDALPFDSAGPVSVNLFNGNAIVTTGGPSFQTVGGELGLEFSYNSQAPQRRGLTGRYFRDCTSPSGDWPTASSLVRLDPEITFDWGSSSPAPMISSDHFCGRWTGVIDVPTTGTYTFGTAADDGSRV